MDFRDKRIWIALLAFSVSIAVAADKDHEHLTVQPASSYPQKLTAENITIAADVYETGDKVKLAFGKHNPYDSGVLPILVVIDNHGPKTIRVDRMRVAYDTRSNGRVEATSPQELRFLHGARQPGANPAPIPIPGVGGISRTRKNPLSDWEIEGRAFAAKLVPPGESVSGFFYFQTGHRSNASLILQGIEEAGSGRELFYFEVPLAPVQ